MPEVQLTPLEALDRLWWHDTPQPITSEEEKKCFDIIREHLTRTESQRVHTLERQLETALIWVNVYRGALLLEEHTAKPDIAMTAQELRIKLDKALAEIGGIK